MAETPIDRACAFSYIRASRFCDGSPARGAAGLFERPEGLMANNPGAKKAARKIERRTEANRSRRSRVRTYLKKFDEALASGDAGAANAAFVVAQSELMRAVGKGVFHPNTGSRKVARLHRQLKKSTQQPTA